MKASNLGATTLRRRGRSATSMSRFDALPKPLRQWMTQAALPWSPASCLRIWQRASATGASERNVLKRLQQAELACLRKDRNKLKNGGIPDCVARF